MQDLQRPRHELSKYNFQYEDIYTVPITICLSSASRANTKGQRVRIKTNDDYGVDSYVADVKFNEN
jgi:hypothetical protein